MTTSGSVWVTLDPKSFSLLGMGTTLSRIDRLIEKRTRRRREVASDAARGTAF